jgi:Holliday junction resolvase
MAPKKDNPREREIQSDIMDYLRSRGGFCRKIHASGLLRDIPDLLYIEAGRVYFFEVKRPGEKPTDRQEKTIGAMIKNGIYAGVVYSLNEVKAVFE